MLDISEAFNKVRHPELIYNITLLGIGREITSPVNDLITNRNYQVRVGSNLSVKELISAGVQQGADKPNNNTNKEILPYANDTTILSHSRNQNFSTRYLQRATDR